MKPRLERPPHNQPTLSSTEFILGHSLLHSPLVLETAHFNNRRETSDHLESLIVSSFPNLLLSPLRTKAYPSRLISPPPNPCLVSPLSISCPLSSCLAHIVALLLSPLVTNHLQFLISLCPSRLLLLQIYSNLSILSSCLWNLIRPFHGL